MKHAGLGAARKQHAGAHAAGAVVAAPPTRRFRGRAVAMGPLLATVSAGVAQARTAAEAQALVERGVAHIRAVGRARAFADFNRSDGGYADGELYIDCLDQNGIVLAHGGNPKLVGDGMTSVRGTSGQPLGLEISTLGLTQGQGWIQYRWPSPADKRVQLKSAFVLKVDHETVCASGYYREGAR